MGARNTNRRRTGSQQSLSGKQPGKKTTKASAPSTTLKEILTLLDLTYDAELGVLGGSSIGVVPQIPVLESLKRTLVKLSDQLEIVSNGDESTILEIQRQTKKLNGEMSTEQSEEPVDVEVREETVENDVEVEKEEDEEEDKEDAFEDANDKLDVSTERKLSVDRIENDPSVRNPKSEFVTSQTLPAAALVLGLFNEDDGSLHQNGEEYLKKKYAVASYPKTDLKDKLPGMIPDVDFSKAKPSNQVQFATFQTFFENFYRAFSDEDIKFLKSKYNIPDSLLNDSTYDPNITPYLIPELGALYSDVWNDEEGQANYSPPPTRITLEAVEPRNSSAELDDGNLDSESVSCGPLVSRLLSAILKDESVESGIEQEDGSRSSITALPDQPGWKVPSVNTDYVTLEDRLKRELKYIGIFTEMGNRSKGDDGDDPGPDWLKPEDDEVSTELRMLQNELRNVSKRNNKRKRILIPIIEQQLAWQEYTSILDDLEKQVDQAYLKRIRAPKNKKRKTGPPTAVPPSLQAQMSQQAAQQAAANSAVKSLLEKRIKWIEKIGPLFDRGDGTDGLKRFPPESVFDTENLDEDEEDDYEDSDELMLQQDN